MKIIDSSAWVEFDRATGSPTDDALTAMIRAGGEHVAVTEPVLMEVLAGARDDTRATQLRRLLTSFEWVSIDQVADFDGAAKLYRACRRAGITPRGLTDFLIATIAVRTDCEVLAADGDFAAIATVVPLRVAMA